MGHTVLIVNDDTAMGAMLERGLKKPGLDAVACTSAAEALDLFETRDFDAVIADVRMTGRGGIELCADIAERRPDVPVIVVTAFGTMETAVEAIRAGAYDFIAKPFDLDALRLRLDRALQHRLLSEEVRRLEEALSRSAPSDGAILGKSRSMSHVHELVERLAPSTTTVLITGESGTGKELVARAIHRASGREGAFVAVNCAAMPELLLEAELFGHVKGAFTDAKAARLGLFLKAQGGTLFLDEIGEMPVGLQPKLLRVLQERVVRPVGGDVEVPFDARILTATNRELEVNVATGRFREDLFYRINVVQIDIPPLRARGTDVLLLAQHFVGHFAAATGRDVTGILPAAAERLVSYPWPGNVRELQNCIERAVVLTRFDRITLDDFPEKLRSWNEPASLLLGGGGTDFVTMDEMERRYVLEVYEACGRNKSTAARVLGFNRKTLYRKLAEYGVSDENSSAE